MPPTVGPLRRVVKRFPGAVAAVAALRRAQTRLGRAVRHGRHWWRRAPDGLPIPPPELLFRVSGAADVEWFLRGGAWAREAIEQLLASAGASLAAGARVLDFGCGCGRVARAWLGSEVDFTGTDYDASAVAWCRRNLKRGHFLTNGPWPPLDLPAASCDLVYALSVFTHLPEAQQRAWFAELGRVIAPEGWLIVSLHGEAYLPELGPEEQGVFRSGKLVVVGSDEAGSNACNAFHPTAAVPDLAAGWDLVVRWPEGARGNPKQDLLLLRKKG